MKGVISLLLFTLNAHAITYGNVVVSNIVSVYDGDTFKVDISQYPPILGDNISIRINGIDTPEKGHRARCDKENYLSIKAKDFVKNILFSAKTITLKNLKRGKYFRIVADVYADDVNLAELLIKNNLAVEYFGKTKTKDWCD